MVKYRPAENVLYVVSHTQGGTLLSCVLTTVGTPKSSTVRPEKSSELDPRGGWQLPSETRGLEE